MSKCVFLFGRVFCDRSYIAFVFVWIECPELIKCNRLVQRVIVD